MAKKENQQLKVVSGEPVELDDEFGSSKPAESTEPTTESSKDTDAKTDPDAKISAPADDVAGGENDAKTTDKDTEATAAEESTAADTKPDKLDEKLAENLTRLTKSTEPTSKDDPKSDEDAPPPPPRPVSPVTQITKDLKDAFPNIDDKYITAVLVASEGKLDPAFNALLYISDPTFKPDIPVPSAPAPAPPPPVGLTDDEKLARKLQKEFEREDRRQRAARDARRKGRPVPPRPQDSDESPDEFGQIKETFTQGFEEARSTLNGWVSGLTRKFQEPNDHSGTNQSPKLFGALGGSSFNSSERKSGFDKDPEILSSDFHTKISMKDEQETAPALPKRQENKWQPLNPEVPVNLDAFLVTDSEDEEGEVRKK